MHELDARGAQARANELGDDRDSRAAVFNGKITGNFNLELNVGTDQGRGDDVYHGGSRPVGQRYADHDL